VVERGEGEEWIMRWEEAVEGGGTPSSLPHHPLFLLIFFLHL